MKKSKTITSIIIFSLVLSLFLFLPKKILATDIDQMIWGGYQNDFVEITGLGLKDPRSVIADLIRVVLGFVGIIAVTLIILAGFKWMVSSGNEDALTAAKGMLANGLIGLIIILSSFGLVDFLLKNLVQATTSF